MGAIGFFGGTFNPPHIGHIQAALRCAHAFALEKVLMIPARHVPGKELPGGGATPEQRLQMIRLAVQDHPELEAWDGEITREGDSYTWETVKALRREYPEQKLVMLLGSDAFLKLPMWKDGEQILQEVAVAVLYRGGKCEQAEVSQVRETLEKTGAEIHLVENEACPISSTQLRRLLAFRCPGDFLPETVLDYILREKLYHVESHWKGLSMEALEAVVLPLLNPNRVRHVLGCRDSAVALARRWGENQVDAARAGLLHDVTKALDGPLQLTLCSAYGRVLDDFSQKYPKTLHALTGSLVAERIFGESEAVVSAICHHTTGCAGMSTLDTIIYVADYIEPNRDFPGVERLRDLAFTDLTAALELGLQMTLDHLKRQGSEVSPQTKQTLDWLSQRKEP